MQVLFRQQHGLFAATPLAVIASYPLAAHTRDVPSHSHPAYEHHGKSISHTSLLRKYTKYVHDTHLQKKRIERVIISLNE